MSNWALVAGAVVVLTSSACQKGDSNAALAERVTKLEGDLAKMREVEQFVRPIMDQQKREADARAEREPDPNVRFAVSVDGNNFEGPADAPVTIVKAFDFACPYCEQVVEPLEQLVKDSAGKVRVVYKNFVIHPDTAMQAHLGSCAAGKQGRFREFKNAFWKKGFDVYKSNGDPKSMGKDNLLVIAAEVGMDKTAFAASMDSEECKRQVSADMAELQKFKVGGTPTFFVNGKYTMFSGPEALKQIVDRELKEVEKSGVPAGEYYQKVVMEKGEKTFKSKGNGG